jgi:DNA-directed RNA polymerase specialized sigma24 family protein
MTTIEETLAEFDQDIQNLARHWSRECPAEWEDLAQEARVAIYLELKAKPDSSRRHLFHEAKFKILTYRTKGSSVDGRLHPGFRGHRVWPLVRLDAPYVVVADRSNPYFKPHQLRPVEDLALTLVAYGELKERLTEQQALYLSLRLQGFNGRAAGRVLGLSKEQVQRLRHEIQEEAEEILLAV